MNVSFQIMLKDGNFQVGSLALRLTYGFWLDRMGRPTFHSFRAVRLRAETSEATFVLAFRLCRKVGAFSSFLWDWGSIKDGLRILSLFCGRGALWHFFRAVNFSGDVSMCTVTVHCVSEGEHIRRLSSSTDFMQLLAVVGAPARAPLR